MTTNASLLHQILNCHVHQVIKVEYSPHRRKDLARPDLDKPSNSARIRSSEERANDRPQPMLTLRLDFHPGVMQHSLTGERHNQLKLTHELSRQGWQLPQFRNEARSQFDTQARKQRAVSDKSVRRMWMHITADV